jgi:hypothetical protein
LLAVDEFAAFALRFAGDFSAGFAASSEGFGGGGIGCTASGVPLEGVDAGCSAELLLAC